MSEIKKVAIVGIGLIGGSIALALKKYTEVKRIIGVSRTSKTISLARKMRVIDVGTKNLKEAVSDADIIFICTPVSIIAKMIREICPFMKKGAIITDTGSTKAKIVSQVEKFIPKEASFIGSHPMAGSELSGVEAANADLFQNAYWILTPTPQTNMEAFQCLHNLLVKLGSHIIAIDPQRHDLIVSVVSHLPHVVSSALMNYAKEKSSRAENLLLLAAGGFRDVTRIAAASPELWLDICFENREILEEAIAGFREELGELSKLIREKDREGLRRRLQIARDARLRLLQIPEVEMAELSELTLPVPNLPGVIRDVVVTIGDLGINIEDINLVHSPRKDFAFLKTIIKGKKQSRRAAKALEKKGYQIRIRDLYEEKSS